jgi:hypothetical protein
MVILPDDGIVAQVAQVRRNSSGDHVGAHPAPDDEQRRMAVGIRRHLLHEEEGKRDGERDHQ